MWCLISLWPRVLQGAHDEAGHQGQQRTLYLVRQRFHWLGLSKDVAEYVRHCRRCVVSKSPEPEARAPLESIRTSEPLELVCIDFWTAEDSDNRSLDVLVDTEHFTKMPHAFLCPNQSAAFRNVCTLIKEPILRVLLSLSCQVWRVFKSLIRRLITRWVMAHVRG